MNETIKRLMKRQAGIEKYGDFATFMAAEFPYKATVTEDAYRAAQTWLATRDHQFHQWYRPQLPIDYSRFVPSPADKMRDVYFADSQHALLFKLTWGGLA